MAAMDSTPQGVWAELRGNRRLQAGLAAVASILAIYFALDWSDALEADSRRLRELRGELRSVRSQTKNAAHWDKAAHELGRVQAAIDRRIWFVSSDAAAQARLNDWLGEALRSAGVPQAKITLAIVRPYGAGERSPAATGAATNAPKAPAAPAVAGQPLELRDPQALRELRATASFVFTPAALEAVLAAIEGGGQFAAVDSLVVNRPARRADLTVKVLAQQVPTGSWEAAVGETPAAAPATSAQPSAAQPSAAAPPPDAGKARP
jgi:hypothetical protein